MRRDDYLKHLDRAFTQAPSGLDASLAEAFRRGERAVKQRHKIMTTLSVAAALAVLCAAIALAAGRMIIPKPDTVAARGGATPNPGEAGVIETQAPTPETVAPDALELVYTQPNSNYYHRAPDCSGMEGAVAWTLESAVSVGKRPCPICVGGEEAAPTDGEQTLTAEIAIDRVKSMDERSANATGFWVLLSSEPNRAWVFYATDYDAREDLYEGGAWYLGENSASLGYSRAVSSWTFCTPEEAWASESEYRGEDDTYGISGEHIAYGGELFCSVTRTGAGGRVHVWKVGEDGVVVELDTGDRLRSIGASGGLLFGLTDEESGDRCFLREYDGQLYQVCGQPEEISAVEQLPGGAALLDELGQNGYTVTDCLYRSMGADTEAEVITVNLAQDGSPYHIYLFRESAADELGCERGWDGDMDILTGSGSIVLDAGLPTVTSGGIEATYRGRMLDASRAEAARGATPSLACMEVMAVGQREAAVDAWDGDAAAFYSTAQGRYFHRDANCGGMREAMPCSLALLRQLRRQPCPVCLADLELPETVFYATDGGTYYHLYPNCSGMLGARGFADEGALVAAGKQPCPVCLDEAPTTCWATPQGQYYHLQQHCMGMRNARVYAQAYCRAQGKRLCPACG